MAQVAKDLGGSIHKKEVKGAVDEYEKYHSLHGGSSDARKQNYADMVNKYYDLSTSFYEYGWGESFHFAHRWVKETLRESIKRHEHYLALVLGLKQGSKVLDVGCGIGGPLREIASFSGAHVTGLNNNAYQITRGTSRHSSLLDATTGDSIVREEENKKRGLDKTCSFIKGDFMNIQAPDNTYDAVYAIEATCHAPDPVGVYSEVLRVLKPGQRFACYEWCMTDTYDPSNAVHKQSKEEIEIGNGLPDLQTCADCVANMKAAGFEILQAEDLTRTAEVAWYAPLSPTMWTANGFRLTIVGRTITRVMVGLLELVGIAPKGSVRVSKFLEKGADGLVVCALAAACPYVTAP
eukprot:scaffold2391_cov381-Prasinococcus_capsulatus_cf.AAC.9